MKLPEVGFTLKVWIAKFPTVILVIGAVTLAIVNVRVVSPTLPDADAGVPPPPALVTDIALLAWCR